jgi:aminoglycoside 6'-N-acetyltransferase I
MEMPEPGEREPELDVVAPTAEPRPILGAAATGWRIARLPEANDLQRSEAARILFDALAHAPSAGPDLLSAEREVASFLREPDRLALLALEDDEVRGWVGAIQHSPSGWELHPLVVDPAFQRQGWGRRLVTALEETARAQGAVALWLGTDDDFGGTSIYGEDLYPDVLGRLRTLESTTGHPFTFYRRMGYTVTGVLPDVSGHGRHDILMAKRI